MIQSFHFPAYAVLALPLAFLGLPLYVYVPSLYAQNPAIGLGMAGGVLFAARLLDLLTDPAVGLLGDRLRHRIHPLGWILFGIPVIAAGVVSLFNPPENADWVYLAVSVSVTYLGWTLLSVPYYSWGAELVKDPSQQRKIAAWREAAVLIGALAALITAASFSDRPMQAMSIAFLALLAAGSLCLFVLPRTKAVRSNKRPTVIDVWRKTGRGMRHLLGLHFVNALAAGIPATLFLMYTSSVLDVSAKQSGILLLIYFVAGVLALPVWVRLAGRVGEVRAWQLAILIAAIGFFPAAFLSTGDFWFFAAICMVTGATLGADIALPAALQARLANYDSHNAGQPREAASFGLWGMAGKLALAFAVGLSFPLLEFLPTDGLRESALPWLYALAPVLVKLLVLIGVESARDLLSTPIYRNSSEEEIDEHEAMVSSHSDVLGAERV